MPDVQMAGPKISIPVIGFGCSNLSNVGRKNATFRECVFKRVPGLKLQNWTGRRP